MKRNSRNSDSEFFIPKQNLKILIESNIGCIASDMITVQGCEVGYMYRDEGETQFDSGWRFFSGQEDQVYADNPENFSFYKLNTIANYDKTIIEFLQLPVGTTLERINDKLVVVRK